MAETNTHTPDRLGTIESRLRRLEERIDRSEMREAAVEPLVVNVSPVGKIPQRRQS
jgi:hypothetical protein